MKSGLVHLVGAVALSISILGLLMVTLSVSASAPDDHAVAPRPTAPTQERVPIRWFMGGGVGVSPEEVAPQQQVVAAFNASHPGISLTLEVHPYGADLLRAQIAAGNPPDIFGPVGVLYAHQFRGQWLDLSSLVTATGYDFSDFDSTLIDLFQVGGEGIVSLPLGVYPSYIYYNRDLFDQAGLAYPPHQYGQPYTDTVYGGPWTIDKLEEIAMMLSLDNAGRNATDPAFDTDNIVQFGYATLWAGAPGEATLFGAGSFVDAHGNAQIPDHWRAALNWHYDGMWEKTFMPNAPYANSDWFGNSNVFDSGHVAMVHCHLWHIRVLGNVLNWDIAAVPAYSDTVTAKIHADTFRILKATDHPTEAFEVLTYLTSNAVPTLTSAYAIFPARISEQAGALGRLNAQYPEVDWQVMVDSIPYLDDPNHQSGLPNLRQAYDRIGEFDDLYRNTPGLNIDVVLDQLRDDLQAIFHEGVDLTIEKVASTDEISAGERITYTITIENYGPVTSVTATVVDRWTPLEAVVGVHAPGCNVDLVEGVITCTHTALTVGTAYLPDPYLVFTTSDTFAGTLTNTAVVTPAGGVAESEPYNNGSGPVEVTIRGEGHRIYLPLVLRN
jgi:multiple sugar transport system substrate-binding protein